MWTLLALWLINAPWRSASTVPDFMSGAMVKLPPLPNQKT